jgi:NADPH:quinone reductase-like Zn-dependent oxidoreductase
MKVAAVTQVGGPEVLALIDWPDPVAGPGQVVVRVRAANVSPTDLAARTGFVVPGQRPVPPVPYVLGWDLAGEVTAVAEDVAEFGVGDRVVGMIHWYEQGGTVGAYAESVAVAADWLVPLPHGLDYTEAATIPLNALTARQGVDLLRPPPAAPVLVTGASSSVGGFAVQMLRAAGHPVIAVAARDDEDWVAKLGATEVLSRDTDLATIDPVPAVFDAVPLGEPALKAVVDGGALLNIRQAPEADPARNLRIEAFLVHRDRQALRQLVDDAAAGRLLTRVDRVLPLGRAAEAHRLVEAGGLRGKIVLAP